MRYGMVGNPFLKKARKYEEEAFRMEQLEYKSKSKSKRLSDAYLKAGEEYEKNGFFERAFSNYKDALKFASKQDEYEIKRRINNLEGRPLKKGELERQLGLAIPAIISFLVALCFISFNLTGNTIGEISQNNSNLISVVLFVTGMIFSFFYFKNQK